MNGVHNGPAKPTLAFIGCGRVARVMATLLQRQGWEVVALASRRPASAQALAAELGRPELACSAQVAVDRADWLWLTVVDDAIEATVQSLRWRPGQAVVHCSGATEVSALDAASQAGAWTGGFHPLQIFSDPNLVERGLSGFTVAVEAQAPGLQSWMEAVVQDLGLQALKLPPGGRPLYHAAAGYAASGLLSVLSEAVALWASLGMNEADALKALLPLARGALAAADHKGLGHAVAGPIARGDGAVVRRQREALAGCSPEQLVFYDALARRQWQLVSQAGRLDAPALQALASALSSPLSAVGATPLGVKGPGV